MDILYKFGLQIYEQSTVMKEKKHMLSIWVVWMIGREILIENFGMDELITGKSLAIFLKIESY